MNKNVAVGQSGGPSSAINASLYGVIKQAWAQPEIDKVYGLHHGIEGLVKGDIIDLSYLKGDGSGTDEFEHLKHTPAAFLRSCRHKLSEDDKTEYEKIFYYFEKYNIGYFFYIGGNDSMDTVSKLCRYAEEIEYDIRIMGVPKTIDNDLVLTDHTPGYASSAKYIGASIMEVMLDTAAYNKPMVTVVEIMGRHAGWLTAAAALALDSKNHDEMMIFLPENPFNMDTFLDEVMRRMSKQNNLLVAVSEGLHFDNGRLVCEGEKESVKDAFGHSALSGCGKVVEDAIKEKLGFRTRCIEFSVLQRCAGHFASLTDITESIMVGQDAVKYAAAGETGKMVCLKRKSIDDYVITTATEDVHDICNKEKFFPKEWMTDDYFVTEDYFKYVKPMIMGELPLTIVDGMPVYSKLRTCGQ